MSIMVLSLSFLFFYFYEPHMKAGEGSVKAP